VRLTPLVLCLSLLLPVGGAAAQSGQASAKSPPSDDSLALPPVMRVVAGEWDWSGDSLLCRKNPHTVSFTRDTAFMVVRFREKFDSTSKQEYRYRLRGFTDHTITGQIEGEQRRNDKGKPVVWDLVLTGPNSYRWRNAGGNPQAMTRAIVRCENGEPLSEAQ